MLELLSKLKHECQSKGVELLNAQINGRAIKMTCSVNGRRDTELNAYIIPDGDSFNFYTIKSQGQKSDEVKIKEDAIIPTLIASINPEAKPEDAVSETKSTDDLVDILKLEVNEGVFDEVEVAHNSRKNSRFAYSEKYRKMGTIVDVKTRSKNSEMHSEEPEVGMKVKFDYLADKKEVTVIDKRGENQSIDLKVKYADGKTEWLGKVGSSYGMYTVINK